MNVHDVAKELGQDLPDAFRAILAEAVKLGWPERYAGDLAIDLGAIRNRGPEAFGWCVRETGTHIFHRLNVAAMATVDATFSGDKRWFFWTGAKLIKCKSAQSCAKRLRAAAR